MADQPQPLQQGAVAPSPVAPPAAAPVSADPSPMPGETPIQFTDRDGTPVVQTAAALAEVFRNRVSEGDRTEFELYQKAFKENDPQAIRKMYEKFMPEAPVVAPTPEQHSEQMSAMNTKIEELTKLVQTGIQPTVQQINTQREIAEFSSSIKANPKDFPCTGLHPQGAEFAQQRYVALTEECKRAGHDPDKFTPQIRSQLAAKAAQDIEQFFAGSIGVFGGRIPGGVPAGPNVSSVNDQGQQNVPGVHKAPYQMTQQGYQDMRLPTGAPIPQEPLPTAAVPLTGGGAPGMVPDQNPNASMTPSRMTELMKAKTQMAAGTV